MPKVVKLAPNPDYKAETAEDKATFEAVNVATARWVSAKTDRDMEKFQDKNQQNLAVDHGGELVYLGSTRVNLQMAQERHPEIRFRATREQSFN